MISVLFWSLANEVCTVSDAKTIYPLMGIAANIALVVAGNYMKWVNKTLTQVQLQLVSTPCIPFLLHRLVYHSSQEESILWSFWVQWAKN